MYRKEERKTTSGSEKPKLSEWDSSTSNKKPESAFKMGNLKMKSMRIEPY
jgi:hypothetical protein